jgi:hypothetical protein
MPNSSNVPNGNPWLILAAILTVVAIVVVVVLFLGIGGDTGENSSY